VYRDSDLDKAKDNWYKWKNANPKKYILWRASQHARLSGRECTLTEDDITLVSFCPVLGYELEYSSGKNNPASASLDRIDNSKGYVKGNVIVVSKRANEIKRDASVEELGKVYKFYEALQGSNKNNNKEDTQVATTITTVKPGPQHRCITGQIVPWDEHQCASCVHRQYLYPVVKRGVPNVQKNVRSPDCKCRDYLTCRHSGT
jgi:hypothetical protein